MISGDNFQFGYRLNNDSYYFSNFNHIWGWASWRSRWQNDYDVDLKHWPKIRDEGRVADWVGTKAEQESLIDTYEKVYQGEIDTWDYQWGFSHRINGRIAVMPNINLISNIGFGAEATHTIGGSVLADMAVEEMDFPLKHPVSVFANRVLDTRFFNNIIERSFYKRVRVKLFNLFKV
jgi:hypothetical protein